MSPTGSAEIAGFAAAGLGLAATTTGTTTATPSARRKRERRENIYCLLLALGQGRVAGFHHAADNFGLSLDPIGKPIVINLLPKIGIERGELADFRG